MLGRSSSPFALAFALSPFLFAVLGTACAEGPDPDVSAVKKRAAFETSCPVSKLKAVWLNDDTLGVSGCGNKLVYVRANQRCNDDCEWILNSDSKPKDE
jgi:hypothetical protein